MNTSAGTYTEYDDAGRLAGWLANKRNKHNYVVIVLKGAKPATVQIGDEDPIEFRNLLLKTMNSL